MSNVTERFLNYVSFSTNSDPDSKIVPSTSMQLVLADVLVKEMKAIGIDDAHVDDFGYVYGTIPANTNKTLPVLGFIAHMDTSSDMNDININPRIIRNYDGRDIILNEDKNIIMDVSSFDHLSRYIGQDLIVTDGTTLLGADDKAGIAEIMTMAQTLIENKEIEHGTIKIAFTPDEEIGCGADHFDVKKFGADFAYTVDGGALGEIEYENFNAASCNVHINGVNIHPGSAKNKMKNAILIGMEFHSMLPVFENPSYTEGYEGFNHLNNINGNVESASLHYIIRDHDMSKFTLKKERFEKIANYLNEKYGDNTITLDIKDTYYNMKEKILPHMHLIENAISVMESIDITPDIRPIRGGTDGARLSFMGLPCPNLCTGGHNYHGRYEYVCIQSMEKIVELLVKLTQIYAI